MPTVFAAVSTHPGLRRDGNEDAYCVRPDLGLYLVADGMGGHAAGEVASRLAVDTIEAFVDDTRDSDLNRTWPFPYDTTLSADGNRLKAAFLLANRKLATAMADKATLNGMATTASSVLVSAGGTVIAHVGDSRVYLWRAGVIRQLTQDHSWVGEQVRAGVLTDADARHHPWRNVVTRAITGKEDPDADIQDIVLEKGDRLLICSDGLYTVVPPERIAAEIGAAQPLDRICDALIVAANDGGGPDNITVIVINVDVA
jgi:serine/threonine protein phosphatase PrpC